VCVCVYIYVCVCVHALDAHQWRLSVAFFLEQFEILL